MFSYIAEKNENNVEKMKKNCIEKELNYFKTKDGTREGQHQ